MSTFDGVQQQVNGKYVSTNSYIPNAEEFGKKLKLMGQIIAGLILLSFLFWFLGA